MKTPLTFLQRVDAIIEAQPAQPAMLELLSTQLELSTSQIYRKIKRKTGSSPSLYIRYKRLELAKILIEQSDLTVTEIARRVGFRQLSYFSRCFSGYFGNSPSSFRK